MNKQWIFDTNEFFFKEIVQNGKRIEARVPDFTVPRKHYHKIKSGDSIVVRLVNKNLEPVSGVEPLIFEVLFNKKYDSIEKLLENEGFKNVMPNMQSSEEAIQYFYTLPGIGERVKENGVCAIYFR